MKTHSHEIFDLEDWLKQQCSGESMDYIDVVPLAILWSKTFDSKFTNMELEEVKRFFQTQLGKKIISAEREAGHVMSEEFNKQIMDHCMARTNAKRSKK